MAGKTSLLLLKSKKVAFSQCEPRPHRVEQPLLTHAGSQ